ncbi:MAG: ABC transporter permease, partial [Gammaproteobacteria bacterium]
MPAIGSRAAGRRRPPQLHGWPLAAALVALPTLLPLGAVVGAALSPDPEIWAHLHRYVLPQVLTNTAWLLAGVGVGTALLGSVLAALVALCDFPGRRVFSWALLLPLAVPTYVLAVAFVGLLDFSAPLPSALREAGIVLPEIRSRGGVIAVMTLALYPYVYLVARAAFATQGLRTLEVARALGMSPPLAFVRASLPLARPWIAAGTLLVLMETLADFGAVAAFNYDTFTTAIYKAWFGLFSLDAALSITAVLLLVVVALVAAEARTRARSRYAAPGAAPAQRLALGRSGWLASALCTLVLLAAFVVPLAQLLHWAWAQAEPFGRHELQLGLRSV